jgi:predicted acylesterase/phospholipase RssA
MAEARHSRVRVCDEELLQSLLQLGPDDDTAAAELNHAADAALRSPPLRASLGGHHGLRRQLAALSWPRRAAEAPRREVELAATRLLCALGVYLPLNGGARPRRPREIRVLALDGGGTRGLLTIEMLKALEAQTGRRVHELFDVIAGTSTGGILAMGIQQRFSLDELEALYLRLAAEVFRKPRLARAQMLLTGATYRAGAFERALREMFAAATERRWGYADGGDDAGCGAAAGGGGGDAGEASMLATRAAQEHCHKLSSVMESRPIAGLSRDCPPHPAHAFVVATISSQAPPGPFLFRNYEYPPAAAAPRHPGSSTASLWEAVRATTAAPTYFQPMTSDTMLRDGEFAEGAEAPPSSASAAAAQQAAADSGGGGGGGAADERMVFQDGALLANNPAAIALSEARALFPGARLACLASFGTGAFEPVAEAKRSVTSFGATVQTLVRAATRTEEVHETLADLLPDSHYYRFNPSLGGQNMTLDETSAEKLRDIQDIGRKYVESGKGADDVRSLAGLLMRGGPPGPVLGTWPLRLIQRVARRSRL